MKYKVGRTTQVNSMYSLKRVDYSALCTLGRLSCDNRVNHERRFILAGSVSDTVAADYMSHRDLANWRLHDGAEVYLL